MKKTYELDLNDEMDQMHDFSLRQAEGMLDTLEEFTQYLRIRVKWEELPEKEMELLEAVQEHWYAIMGEHGVRLL